MDDYLKTFFPDFGERENRNVPRRWIVNVIYTLKGDQFKIWRDEQCEI